MLYSFDINSMQGYEIQLTQPLNIIKPTTIIKSHPPKPKPGDLLLVPIGLLLAELPIFEDRCTGADSCMLPECLLRSHLIKQLLIRTLLGAMGVGLI
ncbi:hypothetical protein BFW97_12495 [Aeromonas hydrophila]|nr:hypothetical protein BFW97_12495 [Aeromonas hydrophila]